MAVGAAIAAVAAIYSGVEGKKAADKQAKISKREAAEMARVKAIENAKLAELQKVNYIKSGVSLKGSPLLVIEETKREGNLEVQNIQNAGSARARAIQGQGRAALVGGIASAANSAYGYAGQNITPKAVS